MCKPISWVEYDGNNYWLTNADLQSKEGKELINFIGNKEDLQGHGAIKKYFGLLDKAGVKEHEINDFVNPTGLPSGLIADIKKGKLSDIFLLSDKESYNLLSVLLSVTGKNEFEKIKQSAEAEYQKIINFNFWDIFSKYPSKYWK